MRYAWLVVLGCSSGPQRPTEPPELEARRPITRDASIDAPEPPANDPDHDGKLGDCDLCPTEPETYNGIIDEDGCPDSSGQSHAVIEDPTNRYAYPIKVRFDGEKPIDMFDFMQLDDGVEAIDVIARSSVDVKPALANKRAAIVAKQVRKHVLQSVRVAERVTGATRIYVDDEVTGDADVLVQVMRARAVEIWKWQDDHLVRATPRRRLPVPKLPPGCPAG